MPEPFSIVTGAFGLTTGSIALLLTTVQTLVNTKHRLQECKERLTQMQLHLEFSRRRLDDWVLRWSNNGLCYPESAYVYVWGNEGWSSIQSRIHCIIEENHRAQRVLLPTTTSEIGDSFTENRSEQQQWKRAVSSATAGRSPVGKRDLLRIGEKIAFAVYQSDELIGRVDRIKKLVDDIEADSKLLAAEVVRKHGEELPTQRTDMVQKFFKKAQPLWSDLKEAHEALSRGPFASAMLFRPPSTNDLWEANEEQPFEVDLICFEGSFWSISECYWISAAYNFHHGRRTDFTTDIQSELLRTRSIGENAVLQNTLKSVFECSVTLSPQDRRRFNKDTELARLRAAAAIATWVMYAWPTAWVDRICSCGIRYAALVDTGKFPVFQRVTYHENDECPGHRIPPSRVGKFMLLGSLLAEIALACPIQVFHNPQLEWKSEWEFELHESHESNTNSSARVDTNGLLRLLSDFSLRPFRGAVEYCLKPKTSEAGYDEICAEDVDTYMRCIVKPLLRQLRVLEKHRNKRPYRFYEPASSGDECTA